MELLESPRPTSSTSEIGPTMDYANKDAQWASPLAREIVKSLLEKVGEMESSRSPSSAAQRKPDFRSKDAAWAELITGEMVKRAEHRKSLEYQSPQLEHVNIYSVPTRLKMLHPKDFDRDDIFLGLFTDMEKYHKPNSPAFKFKVDVVDAFIATLNARIRGAETEAMNPNAQDGRFPDAPQATEWNYNDGQDGGTTGVPKLAHSGPWRKKKAMAAEEPKKSDQEMVNSNLPGRRASSIGWDWEKLRRAVVTNPQQAQNHYSLAREKDTEVVRSLLTMDSVFLCTYMLVYLVQKKYSSSRSRGSVHFHTNDFDIIFEKSPSFHYRILDDIAKLQNQIPLHLLRRVLEILHPDSPDLVKENRDAICRSWIQLHHESLPGYLPKDSDSICKNLDSCEHLLACLCRVTQRKTLQLARNNYSRSRSLSLGHEIKSLTKWLSTRWHRILRRREPQDDISLPSASKMRESGIYFRGHAKGTKKLVPELKHGFLNLSAILYIPRLSVVLNTEMLWRNMLVFLYENNTCKSLPNGSQFIFFLMFMDELIDTEKDVEILREGEHPVIQRNLLGSNKSVAELFNTIISHQVVGKDSYVESEEWRDLLCQIHEFLKQRNRIRFLEFLRDNFGSPVLIVGVVAGLLLFVLSFLQTLYSMLAYYYTISHP